MSSAPEGLFATAAPGLEAILAGEVRSLGHDPALDDGGVRWNAPAGGHSEGNLWLRTAHRVFLTAASVEAGRGVDWVKRLRRAALAPFWDGRSAVSLEVVGAGRSGGQVARGAREVLGLEAVSAAGPEVLRLQLRLARGRAQLLVDSSGEELYRRGHRQEVSRAPMRETLAAGALALAGYSGDEPLWDGLCGSGTLLLEAASLARRRAPGLERAFAFQRWPSHDAAAWEARRVRARAAERPRAPHPLWGSDLHAGALGTARRNARRAGVLEDLTLLRADVAQFEPPPTPGTPAPMKPGLWVSNLPYGKRVGERADLPALYRALVATWKRALPTWRVAFLVQEGAALERAMGRPPSSRFPLVNGGLRCELLVWRP